MAAERNRHWDSHRWLALGVRAFVFLVPIGASVVVTFVASRLVPQPHPVPVRALWWSALLCISTSLLVIVDRLARRLLPMAVLLKVSLVFPDRVPSRWSVAMRAGTTRQLQRRLAEARSGAREGETRR